MRSSLLLLLLVGGFTLPASAADTARIKALTEKIRGVAAHAEGHEPATQAWRELAQSPAAELPQVLAGMDEANVLAVNWLRAAVDTIAERELRNGGQLPRDELKKFILDRKHHPKARRLAYEWLIRTDPQQESALLESFLDDPSLELRRDAVSRVLADGEKQKQAKDQAAAIATYRRALTAARDIDQVKQASEQLKSLGQTVDLISHFGFVTQWQIIGPFDNSEMGGFDVAYSPEKDARLDGKHAGKMGDLTWKPHTTSDSFGVVDLAQVLDKHKGAVAYAYAEFVAERPAEVELRLGSPNANKIWLNGELVTANEVYHSGSQIDQYVGKGRLRAGSNVILLKILQNEQKEDWAQDWKFQLRVCDQYGAPVLAVNRPATQSAALPRSLR